MKNILKCGFIFLLIVFLSASIMAVKSQQKAVNQNQGIISQLPEVMPDFGNIPLYFIENKGQMDSKVAYYIKGSDKTIYFTPEGLTYVLSKIKGKDDVLPKKNYSMMPKEQRLKLQESNSRWVVKLDFVGARRDAKPTGLKKSEAVISYFKGKPEKWKTDLAIYSRIIYRDLWPGIDLVYYGTMEKMKYEFIVHPGADPSQIKLAYRGASSVEVNSEGRLRVETPLGDFEDEQPVGYQEIDGNRVDVEMTYALENDTNAKTSGTKNHVYGFDVGDYNRSFALVLDPAVLIYCSYIGGSKYDYGYGIAVDGSGNAYVTGMAESDEATFPETVGPDLNHNGYDDIFVAKFK